VSKRREVGCTKALSDEVEAVLNRRRIRTHRSHPLLDERERPPWKEGHIYRYCSTRTKNKSELRNQGSQLPISY
jgi:hypothetical protein